MRKVGHSFCTHGGSRAGDKHATVLYRRRCCQFRELLRFSNRRKVGHKLKNSNIYSREDRNKFFNVRKIKIDKTILLTIVLYGCETWSLTLREEFRLEANISMRMESGECCTMRYFIYCILL